MSDGYSLDTNIVIDGRARYPLDTFPTLWTSIENLISIGGAVIAREVLFELKQGDDDCHDWAKVQSGFVVDADDDDLAVVADIVDAYPEWSSMGHNWADPFVIAHAATREWAVVTHERWSRSTLPDRIKIPNVCADFDVECITFTDLLREERWSF
jgi:hypothetical protein